MQAKSKVQILDQPIRLVGETGLTTQVDEDINSAVKDQDWRVPIISYLNNPSRGAERNIRLMAFKYVLINDELYLWIAEYLFLKCLDSNQARVVMRKVHKGNGGIHWSAPNMK